MSMTELCLDWVIAMTRGGVRAVTAMMMGTRRIVQQVEETMKVKDMVFVEAQEGCLTLTLIPSNEMDL